MPNRIIKEDLCRSEKIATLTDFEFRLWVGLITQADDKGCGDARPAILKGCIFPLRERVTSKDIELAIHGLAAKGCVSLYTVGGRPYFWFPTWSKHQRIRNVRPKYPGPEDADGLEQSAANCGEVRPESNPIQSESKNGTRPREAAADSGATCLADGVKKLVRKKYGQYGWVKLTDEEYDRLLNDLGEAEVKRCIAYIDESAQSSGNKNRWRDWNLVIRRCHRDHWGSGTVAGKPNARSVPSDADYLAGWGDVL